MASKSNPRSAALHSDKPSPVAKYEAILLEMAGPGLSEERVSCVFQILDQIQPHMGVFSPIVKRVRNELFDAVYSEHYTGSREEGGEGGRYIQRLPHFTLIRRVYDERAERAEQLQEQLDIVKKRLFEKQREYESSEESISDLHSSVLELQNNCTELEAQLAQKTDDIHRLNEVLSEERERMERVEYDMNCDITELREDLEEAQTEVAYLRQYKTGYDELEAAFVGKGSMLDDIIPKKKKRAAVATKRAHLISGIESAMKLEDQILTVQNLAIEEFDRFMEEHKAELTGKTADENMALEMYEAQQADIERADQQLLIIQTRFQKSMDEMKTELELLSQHKGTLQEQLQILQASRPALHANSKKGRRVREVSVGEGRPETRESGLSVSVSQEDDVADANVDPFIPQERIFSKYAAMMYTSDNNGRTFHEFKDARYCPSCGEKSVLCPHKILSQEHIFPLPPGSTHLKIARPKVRINQQMIDHMFHPAPSDVGIDSLSMMSAHKPHQGRLSTVAGGMSPSLPPDSQGVKSPVESSTDQPPASLPDTPGFSGADAHLVHTAQRLWEDYKARTNVERHVPRQLPQVRVVSVIEQFAAYILWMDDYSEEDEVQSILDNVYSYMLERYIRVDTAFLAMYDFISAIIQYSSTHKMIQLFMQVLIGNYDGAVFRYLLLVCDFIHQVDWKFVEDFRAFASAVYPFLNEDDLETLHMGYTSFSENKVSRKLVMEYVIYIILKYREPRFLEMETKLMNHSGREANFMTESEFTESADAVMTVTNDRLRRRLFTESRLYVKDDVDEGVSVLRLAQLTSYLELLQIAPVVKETVVELVSQSRDQPNSARSVSPRSDSGTTGDYLPTMTGARNLAYSIDRRQKCRQQRMRSNMMC